MKKHLRVVIWHHGATKGASSAALDLGDLSPSLAFDTNSVTLNKLSLNFLTCFKRGLIKFQRIVWGLHRATAGESPLNS